MRDRRRWRNRYPPSLSPTTLDIAWAAGIWEGEGHCAAPVARADRNRISPCPMVTVTQKDPEILRRLAAMFGGRINSFAQGRQRHTYHQWYASGRLAIGFLFTIFTFLSRRRREQVARVVDLWKTRAAHLDLPEPA